ncbi:MAG: hypothetical protein CVU69_02365 [Deltaproteobacteria bacterium HGW-Deltaproteobacteria-4]|nr:MAG: hypothetical protein CVU69_02365 [Deltaproteobacteria bacterium HGW-Deltaproteobacteria-4]
MTWLYFLGPYLYENLPTHSYRVIPYDHLPDMAMYSALSICALVLGFYSIFRRSTGRPISSLNFQLSRPALGRVALIMIAFGVLSRGIDYYLSWVLGPFGQLFQIIDFAPVLAICAGLLYYLRGGRELVILVPVSTYFFLEILLRVSETLFSKIIYIIAGMIIIYILERKKIPWMVIALTFVLVFPVFNSRMLFRMEAHNRWYGLAGAEKLGITELIGKGGGYLMQSYSFSDWDNLGASVETQASSRFENISYLGQCVYLVKDQAKPLKYGETFWWLPLTPVPRAIFPWKPPNYHATLLAEEYGCKGLFSKAAMNFPMLVEMFINFGFVGMVALSFFQGGLYRWCLGKVAYGVGDLNALAFINILWHLEKVESNITMIFGGIFQALITWWLLARFLKVRREEPDETVTIGRDEIRVVGK